MPAPAAFVLFVASLASAAERSEPEQAQHVADVAQVIWDVSAEAPQARAPWAVLLATIAGKESAVSRRILLGHCKPWECDRGRARGLWQLHANGLNRAAWLRSAGDLALQAKLANEQLKRSYWTCARSGVWWVAGTLSAYAGQRCGSEWTGLAPRVATWTRGARRLGL